MTLTNAIKNILSLTANPLTPQEIKALVKEKYPYLYGTVSHISNVEKGHYKNLDHALLAQIYTIVKTSSNFFCDESSKPLKVSLKRKELNSRIKNEDDLLSKLGHYYKRSLDVSKDFGGPSIYFHIQAIKEQETNFISERHIEMIYATLAAWGMHKMGDPDYTKTKMINYSEFKKSILIHGEELRRLRHIVMHQVSLKDYKDYIDNLEQIYHNLKVSISESTIVANSKTLAHILPQLVPPIDRQYTVRFFTQEYKSFFTKKGKYKSVYLPKGISEQFADFKKYCCLIKALFDKCKHQIFTIDKESFNTSYPKIMDNLIMAFVKDVPKPRAK